MDKLIIEGGQPLRGEISISGAKNAVLPILAATLLASGRYTFPGIPGLVDVRTMGQLLSRMGGQVERQGESLVVDTTSLNSSEAPYDLVKTMRASVLVLGPLLARTGRAKVSMPGGCAIGARPINLHLMGLERMGARIQIEHGYVVAEASRLRGAHIYLDLPTVTGTENLMMAATLAEGTTVIENAACEPEVGDVARFLKAMGARITGVGTDTITIHGVSALRPADYRVMPDRIETGTYLVAAAMTRGEIFLRGARAEQMEAVILKLQETGVTIEEQDEGLHVRSNGRPRAVDVKTLPYPGFPTDMQAQIMSLMAVSDGLSVVTETVFENRFTHVAELRRMGADIRVQGSNAIIRGVPRLSGAQVMATDLRASASLVLAGLVAGGKTEVSRIYHLDRGYTCIEEKLSQLGARIRRIRDS